MSPAAPDLVPSQTHTQEGGDSVAHAELTRMPSVRARLAEFGPTRQKPR